MTWLWERIFKKITKSESEKKSQARMGKVIKK
jgi:hypothetical protein